MSYRISVIATVLNEEKAIRSLLDTLIDQTLPPDEIVLADGGSQDHTCEVIKSYQDRLPIQLIFAPGCNISQGRNRAIEAAAGEIIVSTDAGVRLEPDWLEKITQPYRDDRMTQIVAGFFHPDPDPESAFEVAMCATVLPQVEEIDPENFLPSSRSVAFRKNAWEKIGGYPVWLDYSEDLIFDLGLKREYGSFVFVPAAVVHFKPRTSLRSFFRQYYLYARGDGKADLWLKRHIIRYLTYLVVVPGIAGLMLLNPLWGLLYLVGGAIYLKQPYQRLPRLWGKLKFHARFIAVFWVVIIRIVGDIAKMIGYPVGRRWRQKNHPPIW